MKKTLTIALREYTAAVRTKAFLISLLLLPLMMGGGVGISAFSNKYAADVSTKRVAVIDRTPGEQLFEPLKEAADQRNETVVYDASRRQILAKFELIRVPPSGADPAAIEQQRFDLAEKARRGELFGFFEIQPNVLGGPTTKPSAPLASGHEGQGMDRSAATRDDNELRDSSTSDQTDGAAVFYSSNTPTYMNLQQWAQSAIGRVVTQRKIETLGVRRDVARSLLTQTPIVPQALAQKDSGGRIVFENAPDLAVTLVRPVATIMVMFMIVLVGSSPMTMNMMEEKQQKIAEVMLGSVRPFELMMGKLLGGVGVALTLIVIYFGVAGYAVSQLGYGRFVSFDLIAWFVVFSVVAVFLYGSMFLAVGAAVNNAREAQSLITPVMMLVVLPILMLTPMLQAPSGKLAMIFSFFPLSAPMIAMARLTIPPGIPIWQPIVSLIVAILAAILVIWAAGRIFRVGLLLQGKAPRLKDLAQWVIRG